MSALRPDLALISEWIQPGSRVLDLGCGEGVLLRHLQETRECSGYGLEIDARNIQRCVEAGINVLQLDLDAGLSDFDADSFDYVLMTQTLQAVRHPHRVIDEMLRVGRQGIVTFPNFGHWQCRVHLGLFGRMPVSDALPHQWYDTPNIHLCTVRDFQRLCREHRVRVLQRAMLDNHHKTDRLMRMFPNLFAEVALYRFQRA